MNTDLNQGTPETRQETVRAFIWLLVAFVLFAGIIAVDMLREQYLSLNLPPPTTKSIADALREQQTVTQNTLYSAGSRFDSALIVNEVALTAPGFVIARGLDSGTRGSISGVSELVPSGLYSYLLVRPNAGAFEFGHTVQLAIVFDNGNGIFDGEDIDQAATNRDGEPVQVTVTVR
jgi:hypothetical protein